MNDYVGKCIIFIHCFCLFVTSADYIMLTGLTENLGWKESSLPPDSSSSETGKETPPEAVHFTVGDGNDEAITSASTSAPLEKVQHSKNSMIRSYSQDTNSIMCEDKPSLSFLSKSSFSENSLEKLNRSGTNKKYLRDLPTVMSLDDETLSTDSNSTADNEEMKRRRRKLHFPAFKKSKNKFS